MTTETTGHALTATEARKMSREGLVAYANRHCLPVFECSEPEELAAMTLKDLRFELTVIQEVRDDRIADAASYWGEA